MLERELKVTISRRFTLLAWREEELDSLEWIGDAVSTLHIGTGGPSSGHRRNSCQSILAGVKE